MTDELCKMLIFFFSSSGSKGVEDAFCSQQSVKIIYRIYMKSWQYW